MVKFHKIHVNKIGHFTIEIIYKIVGKTELSGFKSKLEANKFIKKYL